MKVLGFNEANIVTIVDSLADKYPKGTDNPRWYSRETMLELYRTMLEGDPLPQK